MHRNRRRFSFYTPHQGLRERTRRLWQVHEGLLSGGTYRKGPGGVREWVALVSDAARHMAHGILPGRSIQHG